MPGLLLLVVIALASAPALGFVSNQSRLDVGPSLEVRVNEPFPVTPEVFENESANVQVMEVWWDTSPALDMNADGHPTNDKDVLELVFLHEGLSQIGPTVFTLWANYSDGLLMNASLRIDVVANRPPVISLGPNPSGTAGDPISFMVVVTDSDSPETSLTFAWDFDVQTDADNDGLPDNDIQSTAKTNVQYTYGAEGTYTAKVTVTDDYAASSTQFIVVTVGKSPGITARTVEVGETNTTDEVLIREGGWVAYHFVSQPGRTYEYSVEVSNGQKVYVAVQTGSEQFLQYRNRVYTAYVAEWSEVNNPSTDITLRFTIDRQADIYVTVDNGYLFDGAGAQAADTTVVVLLDVSVPQPNVAPVFTRATPNGTDVAVTVGSEGAFFVEVDDDGVLPLTISWSVDGVEQGTAAEFVYRPTGADAGSHELRVRISDGEFSDEMTWTVLVPAPPPSRATGGWADTFPLGLAIAAGAGLAAFSWIRRRASGDDDGGKLI